MSEIQNEKKVTDGRKDPLKDVEVPLRDQVLNKLVDKLEELKFGEKLVTMWETAQSERAEWLERQEEYLKTWDEFLESSAEGPFTGSSTLHLPMPLVVARTMHARFMQALLGTDPYFTTKARRADSVDKAALVQELEQYALKEWCNEYQGCEEPADDWIWKWITQGSAFLKPRWETKYSRFVDVVMKPQQSVEYSVDPETGKEVAVPVMRMTEVEEKVTKKVFDGPMLEVKHVENLVVIGGEGNPQRADAVIERYWDTAGSLWSLADQKVFRAKVVEEVIKGGDDRKSGATGVDIHQQVIRDASQASVDTEADLDRYEILEGYVKVDVDGSGIPADVVLWVHKRTAKIFRATYLRRIIRSGKVPYGKIDFHRRPGAPMGVGLIEMMYPLCKELDAMHNIQVDYGLFSTMPFGFYKPTTSMDPEIIDIEPGILIPLDNPQTDVYFPNIGNRAPFSQQQEASIMAWIERLVGLSDINYGILSGNQGAARTATGARVFASESNTNLDVLLRRLNRGWKFILESVLYLMQQRIPAGFSFRVTGETGDDYWRVIKDESEICGDFDFELSPNSSASNRMIQQDTATQILTFVQNPLLIQMGVVSSGNIYEASKNWFKQMGVKDFSKFVTKPEGYQLMLSPVEEANRVLRGIDVPVLPQGDHEGFLAYFEEVMKSDELLGQFDERATIRLAQQAKKHEQMIEALRAAQAQVQNARQAQLNEQNNRLAATVGGSEASQSSPELPTQ